MLSRSTCLAVLALVGSAAAASIPDLHRQLPPAGKPVPGMEYKVCPKENAACTADAECTACLDACKVPDVPDAVATCDELTAWFDQIDCADAPECGDAETWDGTAFGDVVYCTYDFVGWQNNLAGCEAGETMAPSMAPTMAPVA